MSAFRTSRVCITAAHYAALQAFADREALDCADTAAALWLEDRIQADPLLMRFRDRLDKAKKELRAEAKTWKP